MTKQEVIKFRSEFEKAVQSLEDQFGVSISLGTIRFDSQGLRGKMMAVKGPKVAKASKDDFQVGDTVTINHKKMDPSQEFEIIKINNKNIKVRAINVGNGRIGGEYTVSPGLLVKK
ncbi:MAG: hypothetical protein GY777_09650 [Candidatus Brocadiaceae bacterium]|nr:hypothetical protein [Candidatus Brocadiaceae bacterium]